MEAAPRLPMVSFELKVSTENASFGPKLKQYIASFYHEDPETYNNEIHNLESLRSSAVRPAIDVTGCQTLKQYYCQLKFLKSRFPMEKGQTSAVNFAWKDLYSGISYSLPDINFELNCILHNIGALHTQLGATDSRSSSEGMKMSCTHFQCAAWAFQHLREHYAQMVTVALLPEVVHFMQQLCLAQAQECILEKSMMDNRKSTIIAKVAVQVVDYYNSAMQILTTGNEYSTLADVVGNRVLKDWNRYLKFKIAYHSCISLLYQGQQAEEAQKMGERVAYYQAASEHLEEARKIAKGSMGQQQHEVDEALAFTQDVVEGKKKAAKNENEFIYHEVVPEKDALQQVNGASLVRGTPFSVNDPEVSGKDLFSRLVPMEAHEASSLYSEQKAEMIRQIGAIVETKDAELAEFMSSLQLDCLGHFRQAVGVPQEIVDRAAAICAKPQATQALVEIMGRLAGTCHEVDSLLAEIQELIIDEEATELEYQKIMGKRPPGIVSTDLSREAGKYTEAHSKANESNQTLHRAMTMHMSNLKVLAQPLAELKKAIPSSVLADPNIDENVVTELENLVSKVDEMRAQRATLVAQLREAVFADDITPLLVTKPADLPTDQLFQKELTKHKRQASLIEQNLSAQDNILSALTDVYAKFAPTRRYILDVLKRRDATTSALIASYDAYDDLLAKANKGIEFYQKLEGNVGKLQQRVRSACRVNEEEREQMLAKAATKTSGSISAGVASNLPSSTPKLKDYLASMKASSAAAVAPIVVPPIAVETPQWVPVPAIRPTPLGQEENSDKRISCDANYSSYIPNQYPQYQHQPNAYYPQQTPQYYPDPNAYYPQTHQPTQAEIATVPQNYSTGYYQNPEQQNTYKNPEPQKTYASPELQKTYTNMEPQNMYQPPEPQHTQYSHPPPYSTIADPKLVSQYQIPAAYFTGADAKMSQTQQTYPTSYYSTNTSTLAQNYAKPTTYSQNYQMPPNQQNYQIPYYQIPDSYTPSSTPQMNYSFPGIYSPSTDTHAPSQKLEPQQQANNGSQAIPEQQHQQPQLQQQQQPQLQQQPQQQQQQQPQQQQQTQQQFQQQLQPQQQQQQPQLQPQQQQQPTIHVANAYSYQDGYQAPNEEYQQQYQYVPQYYPNYPQVAQPQPQSQTISGYESEMNTSDASNYYSMPYGYQTIGNNSMTMIHANNNSSSKSTTSATNGTSGSNVDLLTGLDFSVSQAPLEPINVPKVDTPVKTKIPEKIIKEEKKPEAEVEAEAQPETKPEIRDPLADLEVLNMFSQEVDKLEKFVDGLTIKTLNGPTPLDIKWKDIQEQQDRDAQKCSISVARCYPMKNRFPDIMPYDHSRVELPSTKDDYINASHITQISKNAPPIIVTQSPLKSTIDDFWTMVWEQQIQVIVCLLGDAEMQQKQQNEVYFPTERGEKLQIGKFQVMLQGVNNQEYWVERIISIGDGNKHLVIVHVQFTNWPGGGLFPTSVGPLISLASSVLVCHRQQRVQNRPILIHCLSGIGRSGILCLLIAAICDPVQLLDVSGAAARISQCRKNILRDREHFKFTYQAVLQHAKDLLTGREIQTKMQNVNIIDETSEVSRKKFTPESFVALKEQGITPVSDTNDPLSALDPLWTIRK